MTKKKSFTKTELKKLHANADKIQPTDNKIRERDLEGATPADAKFYDKMTKNYVKLCGQDASFIFHFLLPESKKPICLFRYCPAEQYERYQVAANKLLWAQWKFLCWTGYIKSLEKEDFIKILPKGEHKDWQGK
jgi:hypothetical protein